METEVKVEEEEVEEVGNPCAYRASISLRVGLPRAFRAPGPAG